ncbi:alpha/beta fold hydrolase [Yoonia sediminilitoris]|uniref:Pimeloyl-ACP methyl ester carboxylesterase n=1 Tax=Yoonia sediminilitoris TaxID=1286148 RepID=A0A2T6KIM9_9RHOB|nr:alpha/beta hydrolase [Yoonia sediminilitoris]PUB15574.1 pimeloyl-ACP methyl ester carboxylesterase [Yoonia sediminilitoris]RCW96183.1 pimeloyl-ACP methyl ester carboxylesterase [Yoonia sediminilitoris]
MLWWIGILTGMVLLAALPFLIERLRPEVGPTARHGADGDFAQLSQGVTHYRWVGPTRGPVAVCVHGLSSPSVAIEGVAEGLGQMGYRVLMYDLYGRGLSDAVKGKQDRAFFLRQLADLLAHQNAQEELTLVGYSMGGQIATAYAAENTHQIKRVILLAAAGIQVKESSFAAFCRSTPLLGDWVHGMFARRRILASIPKSSRQPSVQKVLMAQRQELHRRGYLPSILSSRRGMLSEVHEAEHRMLGREDVPVIAVWGDQDQVIPISALGVLAQWNRSARQEVVEGADHALPYTHVNKLIEAIRSALRD